MSAPMLTAIIVIACTVRMATGNQYSDPLQDVNATGPNPQECSKISASFKTPQRYQYLLPSETAVLICRCYMTSLLDIKCPQWSVLSVPNYFYIHQNSSETCVTEITFNVTREGHLILSEGKLLRGTFRCGYPEHMNKARNISVTWRKSGDLQRCKMSSDCLLSQQVCGSSRFCECPSERPFLVDFGGFSGCYSGSYLGDMCYISKQCYALNSICSGNSCVCRSGYKRQGRSCVNERHDRRKNDSEKEKGGMSPVVIMVILSGTILVLLSVSTAGWKWYVEGNAERRRSTVTRPVESGHNNDPPLPTPPPSYIEIMNNRIQGDSSPPPPYINLQHRWSFPPNQVPSTVGGVQSNNNEQGRH